MNCLHKETLQDLLEMTDGDKECVNEIIREYLKTGAEAVAKLAEAAQVGKPETLKQVAHSFKSSSQYLGALEFASLLAAIEARAIEGDVLGAGDLVEKIKVQYPAVEEELKDVLQQPLI